MEVSFRWRAGWLRPMAGDSGAPGFLPDGPLGRRVRELGASGAVQALQAEAEVDKTRMYLESPSDPFNMVGHYP